MWSKDPAVMAMGSQRTVVTPMKAEDVMDALKMRPTPATVESCSTGDGEDDADGGRGDARSEHHRVHRGNHRAVDGKKGGEE